MLDLISGPVNSCARAMLRVSVAGLLVVLMALVGCEQGSQPLVKSDTSNTSNTSNTGGDASYEQVLRLALETAQPGDVISIPSGVHSFSRSLVLNTDGVTIRGAGMDASVLNFSGQVAGAEGLLVNASDFTIEDLAIEDTVGDALKVNEGRNIVIRRVRTQWQRGAHKDNGAYGIYPVQTENTLVEDSVAIGASDAGIYVGQSRNVIVRNNRAELNVAGIEIENTVAADVYGNTAVNNTGGILIFNMPDLELQGHSTRVFDNDISNNNTANFGVPGSAVAAVPAGSGVVINANDKIEVFDNRIRNNNTSNVLIVSAFNSRYTPKNGSVEGFDPFPESIYLYDNQFEGGGAEPDLPELVQLRDLMFAQTGRLPDVLWDGAKAESKSAAEILCIEGDEVTLVVADVLNDYAAPSSDIGPHRCSLPKLDPVSL